MKKYIILLPLMALFSTISSCNQENILFYPEKLPSEYKFSFNRDFKELLFRVDEKTKLNGLLFQTNSSKGLVFYLHGNAGSIDSWGNIANLYMDNGYDFFILDYRGYGKSEGRIESESQIYHDIQIVYDSLKRTYEERKIVIIGYSIGTGFATQLASTNSPKLLILKAPYYSMLDLAHHYYQMIPSFLIRYKLRTDVFITKVKCPIVIFHGDQDQTIYYESSKKLEELLKKEDKLITLKGQQHNGINENPSYIEELKKILN